MEYTVICEPTSTGYSAYVPDLPGCIATGGNLEEVKQQIKEAIEFHIEGLQLAGEPVPEPSSEALVVEVAGAEAAV